MTDDEPKVPLSVRVEPEDMAVLDAMVGEGKRYKDRSKAVRAAIRLLADQQVDAQPEEATA